ncbi:ribosomal protein S18-alanine N-acetyltransferase [Pseudobutyrivibrio sp.]|uniref:ribosomal protein S18-alanine N-acetyltransferase n=1 Tax=Pseudobutyrivibrio sp. TaxID=2014367 RepID=UPI001DE70439|nr:ribosomal protein S18-alanine N-acetyltransferase [Pseudobutyrivibrio sp.]MBE5911586.1 ribosomal-protein-alanine N-acetyltransferase [Pseudobutyrivibrio sp.]
MAFTFRFATEKDLTNIVDIENASMSCPWSFCSFDEAICSSHAFVIVAEEEGIIVGYSVFYLTPPESELPDIVVKETCRGRGLGRQLLEYSIKELKSRGIETIFLEVRVSNMPARSLYEHMGFEEIGIRKYFYSNPVEDAVCMRLDI